MDFASGGTAVSELETITLSPDEVPDEFITGFQALASDVLSMGAGPWVEIRCKGVDGWITSITVNVFEERKESQP